MTADFRARIAIFFGIGICAPLVNTVLLSRNSPKNSEHSEEGYERGAKKPELRGRRETRSLNNGVEVTPAPFRVGDALGLKKGREK